MYLHERILNPKALSHDARKDVHRLENYPSSQHLILQLCNQLYCMHLKCPLTLLFFIRRIMKQKCWNRFSTYPPLLTWNNTRFWTIKRELYQAEIFLLAWDKVLLACLQKKTVKPLQITHTYTRLFLAATHMYSTNQCLFLPLWTESNAFQCGVAYLRVKNIQAFTFKKEYF